MLSKALSLILQQEYLSCVSEIPRSVEDCTDYDAIEGSESTFWDFRAVKRISTG